MQSSSWVALLLFLRTMSVVSPQIQYTLPPIEGRRGSAHMPYSEVTDVASTSSPSGNPQGIFHYSDNDNTFQSKFKIPDLERLDPIRMASELMSAAAAAENRRKTISGINLPLPFGGKPLNLELTGESRRGVSLRNREEKSAETNHLTPEAREAFSRAKQICLHSSTASCDEALDTFHRLKFGSSLMSSPSSGHLLDDDPTTSFAKMLVPGIEEKLVELEKDMDTNVSTEDNSKSEEAQSDDIRQTNARNYQEEDPPPRDHHPFSNVRSPFTGHTSRMRKIQGFLKRIT
ncbi:hypothetical protein Y032_0572g146 [Ancylostoma ceylanicum]|uniref:Uncharacterized protein n=1 Tax=Ancylostoma ceylanicum TaxID=53326 RepID=A0A016WP26_9BILA|nr:hypothetical protein Y032_0572g146 [Ancylostoma ceylanicum]